MSNRDTAAGGEDPLEGVLYQLFLAHSPQLSVGEVAEVLNIPVADLAQAVGMACRLGFASSTGRTGKGLVRRLTCGDESVGVTMVILMVAMVVMMVVMILTIVIVVMIVIIVVTMMVMIVIVVMKKAEWLLGGCTALNLSPGW